MVSPARENEEAEVPSSPPGLPTLSSPIPSASIGDFDEEDQHGHEGEQQQRKEEEEEDASPVVLSPDQEPSPHIDSDRENFASPSPIAVAALGEQREGEEARLDAVRSSSPSRVDRKRSRESSGSPHQPDEKRWSAERDEEAPNKDKTAEPHVKKEANEEEGSQSGSGSSSGSDSDEEEEEEKPHSMWVARPTRVMTRRAAALVSTGEEEALQEMTLQLKRGDESSAAANKGSNAQQQTSSPASALPAGPGVAAPSGSTSSSRSKQKIAQPPPPVVSVEDMKLEMNHLRRLLLAPFPASLQPPPPSPGGRRTLQPAAAHKLSSAASAGAVASKPTSKPPHSLPLMEESKNLLELLEARTAAAAAAASSTSPHAPDEKEDDAREAETDDAEEEEEESLPRLLRQLCEDKMYMVGAWRRFYDARQRWRVAVATAEGIQTRRQRALSTFPRRSYVRPTPPSIPEPPPPPSEKFEFPSWAPHQQVPAVDLRPVFPEGATLLYPSSPTSSGPSSPTPPPPSSLGATSSGKVKLSEEAARKRRKEGGGKDQQPQQSEIPLVVTGEELALYARYVMSSGKLRHECPEPYQFMSTRAQLLRLRLEGEDVLNLP